MSKKEGSRENLLASGRVQQIETCIQNRSNNAEFSSCQLIKLPRERHCLSAVPVAVVRGHQILPLYRYQRQTHWISIVLIAIHFPLLKQQAHVEIRSYSVIRYVLLCNLLKQHAVHTSHHSFQCSCPPHLPGEGEAYNNRPFQGTWSKREQVMVSAFLWLLLWPRRLGDTRLSKCLSGALDC